MESTMLIEIDLNPRLPIYLQIASGIRAALVDGRLGPGERLPAGRELAQALDVNLDTVQRAYRLLADEGLVTVRVGRGTRVVDQVNRDEIDLRQHIADLVTRATAVGVSTRQLAEMIRSTADTFLT